MSDQRTPRILITRLSHIGDCVFTLPLATAIRDHLPNAWIGWAVESPSHKLLNGHPAIDEIIQVPKGWLKSPTSWRGLRRQFKENRIEISLDPQGLTKSSMLGRISGAKQRIGLAGKWAGEAAPWTYTDRVEPQNEHIVPRTLTLLRPLGIEVSDAPAHLPIDEGTLEAMSTWTKSAHLGGGFVVINPGASWPSKCWEIERFGILAKELGQQQGLTSVVVWAGEQERQSAELVVKHSGGHALVAPPTTLPELAALCQCASLFVSADTGPLHMAAAAGTKSVGLYGPTKPSHCGAWGDHCINLQAWYQDGSRKERRRADNRAMQDIVVDDVLVACQKLLHSDSQKLRVA